MSTTYKFHQDAVWAHLDTTVRDHQDGFNLMVSSDAALCGWILRNATTNEVVQKGGLTNQKSFTAEINRGFKNGYRLTLLVKVDQDQVPVVVNLLPQMEKKESNGISDSFIPDFQENPDHSFNGVVKSLYNQAVQAYTNGDRASALNYLNKAVDLDPAQPQVQAFRQLVQAGGENKTAKSQASTAGTPSNGREEGGSQDGNSADDLAARAKKAERSGDLAKAQSLYKKALVLKPDQTDWTSSLDKINRKLALEKFESALKAKNASKAKTAFDRLKTLDPDNPQLSDWKKQLDNIQTPASGNDNVAQADQFYNLGFNCYRTNDWAGAKKNWVETLKLDPNNEKAISNLQRLTTEHPELK